MEWITTKDFIMAVGYTTIVMASIYSVFKIIDWFVTLKGIKKEMQSISSRLYDLEMQIKYKKWG